MKAFAPACERNKDPILSVLHEILPHRGVVLEIGSGSGQHAVYFARHLPGIQWIPSDRAGELGSVVAWRADGGPANLAPPIALDLYDGQWPLEAADAVVCINTIHIVAWPAVAKLFDGAGRLLSSGGLLYVYGPFRYADRPLEPSNESFDGWLKARDPRSGIRAFEDTDALARRCGFELGGDRAMPANNRSIWWCKA